MCGIAGFLYPFNDAPPSACNERTLQKMILQIAHRGPNGRALEIGAGYGIGHVRLSVIDISNAGDQPMWCPDKRYVLVYNGEIYNYKSLRQELEQKGYNFRSNSDTEVLLYALLAWGEQALRRLEGMFAGGFLDTLTGEALLFRDQMGIKPLYYTSHDGALFFASEIKGFKPVFSNFGINHGALFEHINYRYVAGETTLYQGIKRLLPGHYLKIFPNGKNHFCQYYNVTDSLHVSHSSLNISQDQVEEALRGSIHAHTISDVGYSIQLSGGIDSSYIATVLSCAKQMLDTYSVSIPGSDYDEKEYQDIVAKKCRTRHHDYPCDGEQFSVLFPEVIASLDAPVMHTGSVFLYYLCKHIAMKHKVVLAGEGADELFLGYNRYNIPVSHKMAFRLKQMNIPAYFIPNIPKFRAIRNLMQHDLGMETGVFDSSITQCMQINEGDLSYRKSNIKSFHTLIDQMIASDQTSYLSSLLERQDKVSMAHGLEARVPFCNHKLFELVNPLSNARKVKPVPKAILKAMLAKNYDKSFVYRSKNGFRLPIAQWIRDKKMLGKYLDYLSDMTFKNRNIYKADVVQRMVDRHLKAEKSHASEIFMLLSFEIWARQINS